ncbi:conserved eukaryotic protein that shares a domain with several MCM8 [Cryptosporidium sp. chipmunk genotype I]|uniref:conserved eukaryotic protein that shares a domain with several MCM8 n=1 Tax=Cryptosporidium sp. chipmunk genotype I TaxID=1280935 RepID=UPI00351A6933|nr:conserved eukaryotic protein that shares a domain with several MCM8 [Cryptosporidium sp. chipmunk genotype I]
MLSLLSAFIEQLNHGECDISELISHRKIERSVKGYFIARGMVEYFQEQEFFLLKKGFEDGNFPSSDIFFGYEDLARNSQQNGNNYSSRNVYRFVPIPFENRLHWNYNFANKVNDKDYFSDVYHKFDECIMNIYDFTVELPEHNCSIEVETKKIFSNYMINSTNELRINQGTKNDIKINELLEALTIVELQSLNKYEDLFEMEEKLDHIKLEKFSSRTRGRLVLHVISFKRISNYSPIFCPEIEYYGFLGEFYCPLRTCKLLERLVKYKYPNLDGISGLYNISVEYIANEICDGNYLLSEYILMCICNRQKLKFKPDSENTPNYISNPPQIVLHISMCNNVFVKKLSSFLLNHLPRLIWINADISTLNNGDLTPYFDTERDRFITGILQVPLLRNLIVIDETSLEEGELSEKGLENMSNISFLTNFGYVNYGFTSYQVPIKTESNYIILTSNEKSIFTNKSNFSIRMNTKYTKKNDGLNPQNKLGIMIPNFSEANFSSVLRLYFSIVGSCVEMLEFDEQVQDYIAETFVNIRQRSSLSNLVHTSSLHTWIMLARTQALMNGEEKLSKHRLEKFFKLELERLEKLSSGKNTILN